MNIDFKVLSKKIPGIFIKRADKDNVILCTGAFAVIIALTLPAFLKIYASSTTYISATEYIHARIFAGTGSLFTALTFIFCALTAAAGLIIGPHRIISAISAISIILTIGSLWMMHIPFGQIGAGIYVMIAGLTAIGAGIVKI